MTTRRIDARNFGPALRERMKDDVRIMRDAAFEACGRGVAAAVALTDERGITDQGLYKRSFRARRIPKGAELTNAAPYAGVIEYGRRPKQPGPPLAPIREWVWRKLVGNGEVEPEEADDVAEAVRWSIHIHGTPPRGIVYDVHQRVKVWARENAIKRLRARTRGKR